MPKALPITPGPWKTDQIGIFFTSIRDQKDEPLALIHMRSVYHDGNLSLFLGAEKLSNALFEFLSNWKPTTPKDILEKEKLASVWKEVRGVK